MQLLYIQPEVSENKVKTNPNKAWEVSLLPQTTSMQSNTQLCVA